MYCLIAVLFITANFIVYFHGIIPILSFANGVNYNVIYFDSSVFRTTVNSLMKQFRILETAILCKVIVSPRVRSSECVYVRTVTMPISVLTPIAVTNKICVEEILI